jgi:Carboxypeptidase regulatory-like domain/TonB dependent receptor/TonB-dependent Receptor Plug Domain
MNVSGIRIVSTIFVVLLMTTSLFAQTTTTGAIEAKVTDRSGAALPGVTVELRSPNQQGSKTDVTDANGRFRFGQLTPGTYALVATLSGFSTLRETNLQVSLGKTLTLDVTLSQAVSETIIVSGAAPVVDVNTITTGANVTSKTMESLPLARNYVAAAQIAPGTNADASGVTVYGSTGAENQFIVDGLNTTDVQSGTQGKFLNFDFIQEVEVKTGGLPAEYGRMTGGLINAITKSGGNEYKGDAFAFDSPRSFHAGNKTFAGRSASAASATSERDQLDGGVDVGGYFVKDRVWFFGAYDHLNLRELNTRVNKDLVVPPSAFSPNAYTLPLGASITGTTKRDLYAGKLTFRLTASQNINLSVFGDPSTINGPLFTIAGPPSTFAGALKSGGTDFNGRYNAVIASDYLLDLEAGRHHQQQQYSGGGASIPRLIDATVTPNITVGGFSFFENEVFARNVAKLDLSRYFTKHDVKIGTDYEDLKATHDAFTGGAGQRIYEFISKGVTYYRHRYYVNDLAPGFDRANPSTWVIANPLVSKPETKNVSAYAQDAWKVLPNFTISAGLRWESQEVIGRGGVTAFKLDKNWAPRLGFIWDPANSGRSKFYANVGRFYESIPQDINIRSFGGELLCFCYNFSPNPADTLPDSTAPKKSSVLGSGKELVDPNLKGQYIDEYLVGYEREVATNFAVGVKGTYRKLGSVIEDMLVPSTGAYFIANPGKGIGREAGFYDGVTTGVAPLPKRVYKGVEVDARKRFSSGTQFFASYVWSRLEGNYDGTFQASTGQLDPNINSAYDYADFSVNNHGLLSNDRTHQLKFDGTYEFSSGPVNGMNVGLSAHYASGVPLTAYGYSFAYANWEYYLTPRGSLGRGPAEYEMDFHIGYPIRTGAARVTIVADVFNALNLQRKILLDNRYNLAEDQSCAGVPDAICNGDGGLLAKPGDITQPQTQLTNPRATATNPTFLKGGFAYTDPRTIRVGAKISF